MYGKKLYDTNEELWTKLMETQLTSESYADVMGLTNKNTMFFLDLVKKNTSNLLQFSNIPSRDDLANTTKQVIAVEEKLDDLVFHLDDVTNNLKQNLSNEIANLSNELQTIVGSLKELLEKKDEKQKSRVLTEEQKSKRTQTSKKANEESP
jgi:signal transduction histidine kinase